MINAILRLSIERRFLMLSLYVVKPSWTVSGLI